MRIRPVETSGLPIPFQRRGQGPVIVGSPDPLAWANKADGAKHAWDFIANAARWNGQYIGALANTPNWTFTRASTAYYTNSAGVLTSVASGVLRTGDRGALIEGAGTNLCLQSQTFDNASWTKTRCSIVADAAVAPDGTLTADKIVEDSSNNYHSASQLPTLVSGSVYTTSVFAKAAERSWLQMAEGNNVTAQAYFNLASGVLGVVSGTGTPSATITPLGNGWYRCTLTYTPIANAGNIQARPATGDNGGTYQGDGVSGIYVWGAQSELGFPSSYIPTTTASATRAADSLSVPVSGIAYPLSLYAEFERAVDTGTQEDLLYVYATDSTMRAFIYFSSSDFPTGRVDTSGANVANPQIVSTTVPIAAPKRMALRVATNDTQLSYAGGLATADTSCATPTAPRTIVFGASDSGSFPCFGYLRRAALWPRALTDAELQAVTT